MAGGDAKKHLYTTMSRMPCHAMPLLQGEILDLYETPWFNLIKNQDGQYEIVDGSTRANEWEESSYL